MVLVIILLISIVYALKGTISKKAGIPNAIMLSGGNPKAIMMSISNAQALEDGTLKLEIFYTSSVNGALDFSIGTAIIDPTVDTPQTISTKITDAIVNDVASRGITISKNDIVIFNLQKGS